MDSLETKERAQHVLHDVLGRVCGPGELAARPSRSLLMAFTRALDESLERESCEREMRLQLRRALVLARAPLCWVRVVARSTREELGGLGELDAGSRATLEEWLATLRLRMVHGRELSFCDQLGFYVHEVLPRLGHSLQTWPSGGGKVQVDGAALEELCGDNETRACTRKRRWLRVFLTCMARVPLEQKDEAAPLSTRELEALHEVAARDPVDELLLVSGLMTGLPLGTLVTLRCSDVACLDSQGWSPRSEGTALDGGARFAFPIYPRMRRLLTRYLCTRAREDGPLFRDESCSSFCKRFQAMCHASHLPGRRAEALRHTCCHLLLAAGNSIWQVAKLTHTPLVLAQRRYLEADGSLKRPREPCELPSCLRAKKTLHA